MDSHNSSDRTQQSTKRRSRGRPRKKKNEPIIDFLSSSDEENDVDYQGNIKGLIDYDYDDCNDCNEDSDYIDTIEVEYYEEDNEIDNKKDSPPSKRTRKNKSSEKNYMEKVVYKTLNELFSEPLSSNDIIQFSINGANQYYQTRGRQKEVQSMSKEEVFFRKNLTSEEESYFRIKTAKEKSHYFQLYNELHQGQSQQSVPYKFRLLELTISKTQKQFLWDKIQSLQQMNSSSTEYSKLKDWMDTLFKIPFGKYKQLTLSNTRSATIVNYLEQSRSYLDKAVFGHKTAKIQMLQLLARWIRNPESKGAVIGIQGPMGNGKTTLIKKGLSKALDKPFALITLGGATDACLLEGHSFTYEGAVPGRIAEILSQPHMDCMNPIFYFDELDKISETNRGQEIYNILCHLTDSSQNDQFHDKYFSGIHFDLSRAIFIFSFNDESKIDPIMKDRMTIIRTKGFSTKDKITIARDYLIPEIMTSMKISGKKIIVTDDIIRHIIESYTKEEGVRTLKQSLEIIYEKLNIIHYCCKAKKKPSFLLGLTDFDSVTFPLTLNEQILSSLLTKQDNRDILQYSGMYS